eukprot:34382-Pelagomonas_calceolata.AAC.1
MLSLYAQAAGIVEVLLKHLFQLMLLDLCCWTGPLVEARLCVAAAAAAILCTQAAAIIDALLKSSSKKRCLNAHSLNPAGWPHEWR